MFVSLIIWLANLKPSSYAIDINIFKVSSLITIFLLILYLFCSQDRIRTCITSHLSKYYGFNTISVYQLHHLTMYSSFRIVNNFHLISVVVKHHRSQDRTRTCGLSAVSHRTKYQLFHLTYRKNWWLRLPSSTWVCLYIFSFFLRDFPISIVNLILNRTILSFKTKKLLTNYPLPTDFS